MTGPAPRRHPDLRVAFGDGDRLRLEPPGAPPLVATAELLEVLRLCDGARDAAAIAAELSARGAWAGLSPAGVEALVARALERLTSAGCLGPGEPEASGYGHPAVHRLMLRDLARTDAFRRALEVVVRPGHVVVDVGAGSGVLALLAARAGAARVHAIERSALAATARQVVAANGLEARVRVHAGDARTLPLEGVRADVIVSEWLGHLAVAEAMLPAVAAVRDRCLVEGGALVPARVEVLLAPLEDAGLRADGPAYWATRPFGLDLSPLAAAELARLQPRVERVAPAGLLAPPAPVHAIDVRTAGAGALAARRTVVFEVARDGTLDGFAGWFVADLAPGVVLDTGPGAPSTHWRQHVLPTPPLAVARGARLEVTFELYAPAARGPTHALEVSLEGRPSRYVYG